MIGIILATLLPNDIQVASSVQLNYELIREHFEAAARLRVAGDRSEAKARARVTERVREIVALITEGEHIVRVADSLAHSVEGAEVHGGSLDMSNLSRGN